MMIDDINPKRLFDRVINVVFSIILVLITAAIIIGVAHLCYKLILLLLHPTTRGHYQAMITHVLTLFIMIELSRSLVEYFNTQRLRLTFIADAAIVFVLREIMIGLFEHKFQTSDIYAYSVLLLVLSALRTSSALVFHQERKLKERLATKPRHHTDTRPHT